MTTIDTSGPGFIITTPTAQTYFPRPTITGIPDGSRLPYPDARPNLIEFRQGRWFLLVPIADIDTIGGQPAATTLSGVVNQLTALLS